ncbi:hypothetical protein LEP1GSC188_4508 [Leptospira weilii serovar Topaz str. LT2116]|uniref:Uncharacterized protein n=1 Tax=Leptospira weilii serovar Topaz str. LT2116 TaxID=1088540 RepID=M3FSM2_9LEPT|nr:hypothetical protein LEP1GSC188_4508 [Leptospira weilii serovar Topaz str. LT2116]
MRIFKSIFYFLLLLIVCESIALGAVVWSFLESSLASFELLKVGSDNRARDTLGTLAKAAENSGTDDSYDDMNFIFSRLVKVSDKDTDGYAIKEIFLTNEVGIVLAHSNSEYLRESLKKRKPVALYQDSLYTRAFRLRKWQIGIPVLLRKKEGASKSIFFSKFESFFPEINEPEILLSAAVYHPVKLERVAAIHMIYDRGNFRKFVFRQTELLEWLLRNDSLIALGAAVFLECIYLLLTLGNPTKKLVLDRNSKPLVEKVSHTNATHIPVLVKKSSPLDSVVFPGSLGSPTENVEVASVQTTPVAAAPVESTQAVSYSETESTTQQKVEAAQMEPVISQFNPGIAAEEVLDAIYLG